MHIRNARPEDIGELAEMLGQLFSIEKDFAPRPVLHATALSMILDDLSYRLVVAADPDDHPVGMFSLHILISTAEGGRVGLIEDVFVREKYRRKGVGRALMDEAGRIVRREGLIRLQLLADRDNAPALDFYSRMGWKETSMIALKKMM